jgi:hypothetical protein
MAFSEVQSKNNSPDTSNLTNYNLCKPMKENRNSSNRKVVYDINNADMTSQWSKIALEYMSDRPGTRVLSKLELANLLYPTNPIKTRNFPVMSRNTEHIRMGATNGRRNCTAGIKSHRSNNLNLAKIKSKFAISHKSSRAKLTSEDIVMKAAITFGDPLISTKVNN